MDLSLVLGLSFPICKMRHVALKLPGGLLFCVILDL